MRFSIQTIVGPVEQGNLAFNNALAEALQNEQNVLLNSGYDGIQNALWAIVKVVH